ncbi:nucleotidyltransferase [Dorea sp. AF36-15AT]|uniref:nucleotidyltransferase n=1 Tax=Dorea sp. AF36-15AT TaxID=2292041 RepID=UPI000E47B26C|nr:nucleotidyltransferase [Dorea sp. AF36-15AT]RHP11142.1 nucleotidyltransferase [Dorea sp. AF36-15AT]
MKTVGLITEYNPFHNGHAYHIEKAKMLTGADRVIVVMSGDFVQRGAPAVMPKHLRAKSALLSGASLIIELPVCFATGSAEYFAQGSISLLNQLGCIDSICFGSECGDLHLLKEIAQILADEPIEYQTALKQALKEGASFPAARQEALNIYSDKYSEILASPNNILGIEYLKALAKIHSKMEPFTIKRIGAGYHDMNIDGQFSSATAIRSDIYQLADVNSSSESLPLTHIQTQVPSSCHELMKKNYQTRYPVKADDFSLLLKAKLLSETAGSLSHYLDMSPELANRILRLRNDYLSFEQFCDLLKTKELTRSRISRSFIHVLLGITNDWLTAMKAPAPYARILGFRRDHADLLGILKRTSDIPLITSPARAVLADTAYQMLELDIYASNLYESVITDLYGTPFHNELTKQIIKI